LFVTVSIALFIGSRFFFVGVALALWTVVMMIVVPVVRALGKLQTRPGLRERRWRIYAAASAATLTFALAAALVPLPYRSQAEGVIWLPEHSTLRAGAAGFISRLEAQTGAQVNAGAALITSIDPALEAQVRLLEARVAELEASYGNEFVVDRARAEIVRDQLLLERQALARALERARNLVATAPVAGAFTVAQPADLPGRYHRQGEVLGYVLTGGEPIVRVVVEQAEIDVVAASRRVEFRLADDVERIIAGRIVRQVPAGAAEAPSRALVASGGGKLAADPRDPQGKKTLERVFEIDVEPLEPIGRPAAYGQRVFVRFDMQPAPLATQMYRMLRRLFLSHFDV